MPALLDPREEHFRIPSSHAGLSLFLRHLPPPTARRRARRALCAWRDVPSALSIAHRFDGRSWRDELCAAGFDVWGLDFHGYGHSDPYPAMSAPPDGREPLCTAEDASQQLEQAVRFICRHHAIERISHHRAFLGHDRGRPLRRTLPWSGRSAGAVRRHRPPRRQRGAGYPAWRLVSLQDQWQRFTAEVPSGELPVLSRRHFAEWGERYLDSDPASRTRTPPGVQTPSGLVRHRLRLGRRSCLRASTCARAGGDHSRRVGQHVQRCRRGLAVRRVHVVADPSRREDQPRHASDAPGGEPLCAVPRDAEFPRGRRRAGRRGLKQRGGRDVRCDLRSATEIGPLGPVSRIWRSSFARNSSGSTASSTTSATRAGAPRAACCRFRPGPMRKR